MTLSNREWGYQLSGIEYSLIFEKEDMGFVRFADRSQKLFYLDPSPFLDTVKPELYVLENGVSPKRGELIEVTVSQTDSEVIPEKDEYKRMKYKFVKNWQKSDPNKLIHRKTVNTYEFKEFFSRPFKSNNKENIDFNHTVGCCLSLYAVSSPQISDFEKGGLHSGMLGRKREWNTVKRIMNVIPNEFKQVSSRNFYRILDNEESINPIDSTEVSLAYFNPSKIPVQIPIVMDVEPISDFYNIDYEIPMIRSHILDAILHQPEIPKKLESYVTDCVYNLIDDVKKSGRMPYKQDLSAIPKLSLAIARINFENELTKNDAIECVDLWGEMFKKAKKITSTQLDSKNIYKLSENARKVYIDLHEIFGKDVMINRENLATRLKISEWDLEDILLELNQKGAIFSPGIKQIRILDY
jgi:hypothetical protein